MKKINNLIIVESPTKAKTIGAFLDNDYKILSSYGHVRDLPKSALGIDVDNDFKIKYVIPTKARKNVNLLKKEVEKADMVYIATCLLYTSDAADDLLCVDLGGRRIIKKKTN